MRKTIVAGFAAISLLLAGAGAAIAEPGKAGTHDPRDENTHNDQGKCTAFFNGKKNGHTPPEQDVLEAIYGECEGLIKGNPVDNGRFPGCFDGDQPEDDDDDVCNDDDPES